MDGPLRDRASGEIWIARWRAAADPIDSPLMWKKRWPVHPFLILQESVEKAPVDQLGLVYQHAHQFALRVEEAAVRDAGVPWRQYDAFMQRYIKVAEQRPDLHIPPDLDLEPYKDENDAPLLRRLRRDSRRNHHTRRRQ